MTKKSAPKAKAVAPATVVKTTPARNSPIPKSVAPMATPAPAAKKEITNEMIAKRAYEIFVGGTGGDQMHNWLRAERELKGL
jgi:hypothetical protein